MRSLFMYLTISIMALLVLGACTPTKSNNPGASPNPNVLPLGVLSADQIKYPAAIIYEGGAYEGQTSHPYSDTAKRLPIWRLYICMAKTKKPIRNTINLDLEVLGHPPIYDIYAQDKRYNRTLKNILISYSYTSEIVTHASQGKTVSAYGKARFKSKLQSRWSLQRPAIRPENIETENLEVYLNNQVTTFSGIKNFPNNTYIKAWSERYADAKNLNIYEVISACENSSSPIFFQKLR